MEHALIRRRDAAQATLDAWSKRPWRMGSADCVRMTAAHLRLLGHEVRLPPEGSYRSAKSALAALADRGFVSLGDALDGHGLERISPAAAIVGDIVLMPAEHELGALTVALGNGRVVGWHDDLVAGAARPGLLLLATLAGLDLPITAMLVLLPLAVGLGAGGFALGSVLSTVATAGLTGIAGSIAAGVVLGSIALDLSLLLPKPSAGGEQTKWKADPYAGIPYAMGRTLVSGNIVYRAGSGGSNEYEHFVTVLSVGPIQSIDTSFFNKTTVNFNGDGSAQGTYGGYIWQRSQLGACPEPAALTFGAGAAPGWGASSKLSGLAATTITLRYDAKSKNGLTSEPQPGWIVHGVRVYDPRLDSTYPGGSGACRALQESTYVWSENPHLHALTWCLGRWQNGVRVAGIGAALAQIDVASFVEGANLDDARGWKIGGQVVTRPDTPWNSLKAMLQAGGAQPILSRGVIGCLNRAPRVSLATITRSDIVGQCTFSGTQSRRARINGVIPTYRSEANDWQLVAAAGVFVASYVTLDGDERTQEITYPLVQDVNQASQLARYDIEDAREAGPGTVPLKPWWLNYRIGDALTFEPEDGLSIKVLMTGRALDAGSGVVTYTIKGETDAKHAYALGQTGTAPPAASLTYDTGVPAPGAADWTMTAPTAALPTIKLDYESGNSSADAIIFQYRVAGASDWTDAGAGSPSVTTWSIAVQPGQQYESAVSYRVRGIISPPLVLEPVTTGAIGDGGVSPTDFQALIQRVAKIDGGSTSQP